MRSYRFKRVLATRSAPFVSEQDGILGDKRTYSLLLCPDTVILYDSNPDTGVLLIFEREQFYYRTYAYVQGVLLNFTTSTKPFILKDTKKLQIQTLLGIK